MSDDQEPENLMLRYLREFRDGQRNVNEDICGIPRRMSNLETCVAGLRSDIAHLHRERYNQGWDAAMALMNYAAAKARGGNPFNQAEKGEHHTSGANGHRSGSIAELAVKIALETPGLKRKEILEQVRKITPNAIEKAVSNGLYRSEILKSRGGDWYPKATQRRALGLHAATP